MINPRTPHKQTALADFRELILHLVRGPGGWISPRFRADILGRPIVCTPYDGAYGQAGWIICLNGSPPRCTIIAEHGRTPTVILSGRSRRLGEQQAKVVQRFVVKHLARRGRVLVIEGVAT